MSGLIVTCLLLAYFIANTAIEVKVKRRRRMGWAGAAQVRAGPRRSPDGSMVRRCEPVQNVRMTPGALTLKASTKLQENPMPAQCYRSLIVCLCASLAWSQQAPPAASGGTGPAAKNASDPIAVIVGRLELDRYKATIKGLTQFGDRRQGTDRNRAAIDWIEAQLKSYGCTNTERIHYDYQPPAAGAPRTGAGRGGDPSGGSGWLAPSRQHLPRHRE
jgi:hypothetical protein